jgi:hypothetical protein
MGTGKPPQERSYKKEDHVKPRQPMTSGPKKTAFQKALDNVKPSHPMTEEQKNTEYRKAFFRWRKREADKEKAEEHQLKQLSSKNTAHSVEERNAITKAQKEVKIRKKLGFM